MTLRVFIIDDDRDNAESIADVVKIKGFEVEIAFSGEAALARFREVDFDIVFMDVKLPRMNGVETFFEFKKIRPDTKVMLMSGYSLEHLVAQAIENGALGFLSKPFGIEELLDAIQQVKPRGMVLVADDDPEFAESIKPILLQHGYVVEIARTGAEALMRAGTKTVNCLILDLRLPILSGLEVYRRLKESGWNQPTIFVTGFASERNLAMTGLEQPLTHGILMKPFDPAELLAAIKAATNGTGVLPARPAA
jgi:two-component system, NtrC family, response regulator HydG